MENTNEKTDSAPENVAEIKTEETVISTTELNVLETNIPMTAERISVDDNVQLPKSQHPNDVKFKVKYSKDFKGDKTFTDGSVQIISKESAEHFTKIGIGAIVKN